MHYRTKQLHNTQSRDIQPKGSNAIELTLNERGTAKVCGTVTTLTRANRARLMALIQEGFKAVGEGADPEAIAQVIRSEVSYECVR